MRGQPPRSNGRAVIRSTNARRRGDDRDLARHDRGARRSDDAWDVTAGLHPDQHAIAFATRRHASRSSAPTAASSASTSTDPVDRSARARTAATSMTRPRPDAARADDLADCRAAGGHPGRHRRRSTTGCARCSSSRLSFNPRTRRAATSWAAPRTTARGPSRGLSRPWFESSAATAGSPASTRTTPMIRYHNYFDATPEVNFHGDDPTTVAGRSTTRCSSPTSRARSTRRSSPTRGRRAALFTGLEHVWRTDDNGGTGGGARRAMPATTLHLDPGRSSAATGRASGAKLTRSGDPGPLRRGGRALADATTGRCGRAREGPRVLANANAARSPDGARSPRVEGRVAARALRLRDRRRPGRSEPRVGELHRLRRLHAGTPGHVFAVHATTRGRRRGDRPHADLGDQPVTDLVHDDTGDLYAATDFGVLRLPAARPRGAEAGPASRSSPCTA